MDAGRLHASLMADWMPTQLLPSPADPAKLFSLGERRERGKRVAERAAATEKPCFNSHKAENAASWLSQICLALWVVLQILQILFIPRLSLKHFKSPQKVEKHKTEIKTARA